MISYATLVEALEAAPRDKPFVTEWIDEDESKCVTFGEFREQALQQAAALANQGLAPGDRVVLIMPQSIAAMTGFVAAMMLGAVPAFLAYPNFKVEPGKYRSGLAGVTANLRARLVLIDEAFPDEMLACVSLDPEAKLVRLSANENRNGVSQWQGTLPTIRPECLAFIQHSAGTTGLQKGVALTHAAVLRQIGYLADALRVDSATDRIYSWLPLYHDMGLIACFMLPMVCHVALVMQSPLDWVMHPDSFLEIINAHRCTLAWMPNFAFQFIPRRTPAGRRGRSDLSSLRGLINCSEPVRSSSMAEFRNTFAVGERVLQSSYAMAENVFAVTQSAIDSAPPTIWVDGQQFRTSHRVVRVEEGAHGALAFMSSGRLLPHHELRIVSAAGRPAGDDAVGEILIKSDCLFDGYYNRPDLTGEAVFDGWYHTGDLGFYVDGEVYVVGRKKDLLIVGGENIYPQDVEEIVAGHPAIHDGRVIAMGLYNADLGTEDIVVVAEVEQDELLEDRLEIESQIRGRIVSAMGLAVRTILLKPPKWVVKSTAGKAGRSATREKLLREHPELARGEG